MNQKVLIGRSRKGRMAAALSVVVLVSLAIAGCSKDATEEQAVDTTVAAQATSIVIAIADEPSTLDPQATEDGNERAVTDNIYETLLRRDSATNELVPWLASEMPTMVSDTKWQFKLREGVTFSNGDPFNAEAAAFSINRVMNKEYNSGQIDFYGGIVDAVAIDALTVEVNLSAADPVFPARMYRLKMLDPKTTDASIIEKAVGTGPYMLGAWNRGQDITLTVNPTYWGVKPVITDVTIKFIPEANTRAAGLQSGEIQLATLLPPEQAKDAPQVITRDGIEFPVYRFKNYEGVLKDPRIRQALNYAVDKVALANDLFSGYASVAQCQPLTPSHFGFNADLKPYPYDPEKAKALLEEAGYKGEEVSLLGATGRWLKDAEMTQAVIGYLTAVGVNIKADIRPFSSYIGEFVQNRQSGKPQANIGFVSASNELFDASKIETYYSGTGGLASYVNADVDNELLAARSATDSATRLEHFNKALEIGCTADPVFIFTVVLQDIYGASANLSWTPRADGMIYISDMVLN